MLFADDAAALFAHTEEDLKLTDRFSHGCEEVGLTISIKKTTDMGQGVIASSSINIDNASLDVPPSTLDVPPSTLDVPPATT